MIDLTNPLHPNQPPMQSLALSKRYKEEKKAEKERNKKEKVIQKQKDKSQSVSLSKWKSATKKWKSATKIHKPKKTKKLSRWKLVKKLDKIFSQYTRLKYARSDGMVQCVTSKQWYHWKEIQAGHFITRGNYKYRWDEDNVFPQSYVDNCIKNGNYKEYTLFMIDKYWKDRVEEMVSDKQLVKISTAWIEEKIDYYNGLVKDLLYKIQ